jgi:hypothetical protein
MAALVRGGFSWLQQKSFLLRQQVAYQSADKSLAKLIFSQGSAASPLCCAERLRLSGDVSLFSFAASRKKKLVRQHFRRLGTFQSLANRCHTGHGDRRALSTINKHGTPMRSRESNLLESAVFWTWQNRNGNLSIRLQARFAWS